MSSSSQNTMSHEKVNFQLPGEYVAPVQEDEYTGEGGTEKSEECICSFFDKELPSPTLEIYQREQLKESLLFSDIYTLNNGEKLCVEKPTVDPNESILVTGFGMRNVASFHNALESEERRRLYEIYKTRKENEPVVCDQSSESLILSSPMITSPSKKSIETETDLSSVSSGSGVSIQQEKLRYLMGLGADAAEEETYPRDEDLLKEMFSKVSADKFAFSQVSTTRLAQTYLRTHRIFDFFQFIITHLLSAAPENPIVFILVLLNKILLYRSGTGNPPLLYERKHIDQLFTLMDRMNSGYIDLSQYETGMKSIGICEFNKSPELSNEGLVSREIFINEALESELALFNDLIKRKWTGMKPKLGKNFSRTDFPVRSYISGTDFIPSDLLLTCSKHFPSAMDEQTHEIEEMNQCG